MQEYWTFKQAADYLGCTVYALRKRVERGQLGSYGPQGFTLPIHEERPGRIHGIRSEESTWQKLNAIKLKLVNSVSSVGVTIGKPGKPTSAVLLTSASNFCG